VFLQPVKQFLPPTLGGSPEAPGAPGANVNSMSMNVKNGAGNSPLVPQGGQIVNMLTIRGRDQVMLTVTVAEIDRNIAKQLGITTSSLTASWARSRKLIRSRHARPRIAHPQE